MTEPHDQDSTFLADAIYLVSHQKLILDENYHPVPISSIVTFFVAKAQVPKIL